MARTSLRLLALAAFSLMVLAQPAEAQPPVNVEE
jgi:hypothetical protein